MVERLSKNTSRLKSAKESALLKEINITHIANNFFLQQAHEDQMIPVLIRHQLMYPK